MSLPWTHNPTATRFLDGTVVVYHIGVGTANGKPVTNCTGGHTNHAALWASAGAEASPRGS